MKIKELLANKSVLYFIAGAGALLSRVHQGLASECSASRTVGIHLLLAIYRHFLLAIYRHVFFYWRFIAMFSFIGDLSPFLIALQTSPSCFVKKCLLYILSTTNIPKTAMRFFLQASL